MPALTDWSDIYDDLDWDDLISSDPLNEALVMWLIGIPPLDGSRKWYDITQNQIGATISGTTGAAWSATGRGDSGIKLAGSPNFAELKNAVRFPNLNGAYSAACTAYVTSVSGTQAAFFIGDGTGDGPTNGIELNLRSGNWSVSLAGGSAGCAGAAATALVPARMLVTSDGTNLSLFINGRSLTTGTWSPTSGAIANFEIGRYFQSSSFDSLTGGVSDVKFWARLLSQSDAIADFDAAQSGYQGQLNRRSSRVVFLVGAQVSFVGDEDDLWLPRSGAIQLVPWKGYPFANDDEFVTFAPKLEEEIALPSSAQLSYRSSTVFSDEGTDSTSLSNFYLEIEQPWAGAAQLIPWKSVPFADTDELFYVSADDELPWRFATQAVIWKPLTFLDNDELFYVASDDELPWVGALQSTTWRSVPFWDESLDSVTLANLFLEVEQAWPQLIQSTPWKASPFIDEDTLYSVASISVDEEFPWIGARQAVAWNSVPFLDEGTDASSLAFFYLETEQAWSGSIQAAIWKPLPFLDDDAIGGVGLEIEQAWIGSIQSVAWKSVPFLDTDELSRFGTDEELPWRGSVQSVAWASRTFLDESIHSVSLGNFFLEDEQPWMGASQFVRWLPVVLVDEDGLGIASPNFSPRRPFRRSRSSRIFRGYPRMSQILSTRLPIDVAEVRAFLFDFSQCDEAKAGLTLASATVSPSTGVAIGTPAIITTETNGIMAGLGVQVTLSVAAAAVYDVKCIGIFVGGSTVVVKGELVGES